MAAPRQNAALTGRTRGADDGIPRHLRQSFFPGELTAEDTNRSGCEPARRFARGPHASVVCSRIVKKQRRSCCAAASTPGVYRAVERCETEPPG